MAQEHSSHHVHRERTIVKEVEDDEFECDDQECISYGTRHQASHSYHPHSQNDFTAPHSYRLGARLRNLFVGPPAADADEVLVEQETVKVVRVKYNKDGKRNGHLDVSTVDEEHRLGEAVKGKYRGSAGSISTRSGSEVDHVRYRALSGANGIKHRVGETEREVKKQPGSLLGNIWSAVTTALSSTDDRHRVIEHRAGRKYNKAKSNAYGAAHDFKTEADRVAADAKHQAGRAAENVLDTVPDLRDVVEEKADKAKEQAKDTIEHATDAIGKAAEEAAQRYNTAKERASQGAQRARETVEDGIKKVQETAEEAAALLKEKAAKAAEAVNETKETVKHQVEETAEGVKRRVENAAHRVKAELDETVEALRKSAKNAKGKAHNVKEGVKGIPQTLREGVRETAHTIKKNAHNLKKGVEHTAHNVKQGAKFTAQDVRKHVKQGSESVLHTFESAAECLGTRGPRTQGWHPHAGLPGLGTYGGPITGTPFANPVPVTAFYTALSTLWFVWLASRVHKARTRTQIYHGSGALQLALESSPSVLLSQTTTTPSTSQTITTTHETTDETPHITHIHHLIRAIDARRTFTTTVPVYLIVLGAMELGGAYRPLLHMLSWAVLVASVVMTEYGILQPTAHAPGSARAVGAGITAAIVLFAACKAMYLVVTCAGRPVV
ncbi:uncharacterized protein EV422DRAFT_51791 [Fimicolochytrium jonesii]|uniref:uncharacterized protein n=1 Tax=Fimicolochytrium jonesii TaxID=1396493 RepID=UPI0022FEF3F8|nr:uncharacterized protein EV422DRAFT_51791 [Fimicolochytrium jonesii]KAI8821086.1 hypothetical protein EV422DRAFT_51791 [Fimicolochytrium jonesii]